MWQEKIRKYVCYHNRNLLKVSKLRFKNDYLSHLEWMRDIFLVLSQKSLVHKNLKYDSSILNAAFIADDACHSKQSKRQQLDFLLNILIQHLKNAESVLPNAISETKAFNFNIQNLKSKFNEIPPITIFSPSHYSLFTLSTIKLLLALNIQIDSIVFLNFSYQRFRSELYRDGLSLFAKRVWRKLILKADENKDQSTIGLKSFYQAVNKDNKDILKFARLNQIEIFKVNRFNDYIRQTQSPNGSFCIFTGGGLIDKELLDYFTNGVLNIHMGSLPQYKGMDVVEAPILDGCFDAVALTAHLMKEQLDAGPVIQEIKFNSDNYYSLGMLRNEMSAFMPILAVDSAIKVLKGDLNPCPQVKGGKQYYFIHKRLRDALSEVLKFRNKQKNLHPINREKNLDLYNAVVEDFCK